MWIVLSNLIRDLYLSDPQRVEQIFPTPEIHTQLESPNHFGHSGKLQDINFDSDSFFGKYEIYESI